MQGIHTTNQANVFDALKHSLNFDIERAGKDQSSATTAYLLAGAKIQNCAS